MRPVSLFTALLVLLSLAVILFGAYVRLSDAGLGCPDWPGCYGRLVVPDTAAADPQLHAQRPLVAAKAWKEMIHRYLAGTLGLGILLLFVISWRYRPSGERFYPSLTLILVIFQALLGMWTVTLKVKPLVVTAHLLGGMGTLALLWWHWLRIAGGYYAIRWQQASRYRPWVLLALLLLVLQVFLGGWTSSNYAAFGCVELPTCSAGRWWPETDFSEAFVLWRGIGVNYEFGVLDAPARTAIHLAHRIGALLLTGYLLLLCLRGIKADLDPQVNRAFGWVLLALLLQISLGISNILFALPLPLAVAHNGGAALLLLSLLLLLDRSLGGRARTL